MKTTSVLLVLLGISGLLFLGAEDNLPTGFRPHPRQNTDVPKAGYLVVTTPAGEYVVDRRDVMSLSSHNYEINGGMRVWEVTVSERSTNTVRFYYTKKIETKAELAGDASDEGEGGKLDKLRRDSGTTRPPLPPQVKESKLRLPVRKDYPATTHSHTIEFRLNKLQDLEEIYSYFTLMVYGWSPKQERPASARDMKVLEVGGPRWSDWDDTTTN
ncbi:MAG TPA: hypothetical protein VG796_10385 [Verrucomicrobiales bacterium]|jgi:hypothetical protein|nr:hypothetical protein [Verrucomicrobiales bacterium]